MKIGTVFKAGKEIVLSVATETSDWAGPVDVAVKHGPSFMDALDKNYDVILPDTKELVSRYYLTIVMISRSLTDAMQGLCTQE